MDINLDTLSSKELFELVGKAISKLSGRTRESKWPNDVNPVEEDLNASRSYLDSAQEYWKED